jgi:hypothetical protein
LKADLHVASAEEVRISSSETRDTEVRTFEWPANWARTSPLSMSYALATALVLLLGFIGSLADLGHEIQGIGVCHGFGSRQGSNCAFADWGPACLSKQEISVGEPASYPQLMAYAHKP